MIKFIHSLTGTVMWVADERKEEYLRAGHRLAPVPCAKPAKVVVEEKPKEVVKEEPVKATPIKKTTKKAGRRK